MRGDSPACLRCPGALLAHVPASVSSCLTTSSCWERAILWVAVAEIVSETEIANNVNPKHPAPHALASCQPQQSLLLLTAASSKARARTSTECPPPAPQSCPRAGSDGVRAVGQEARCWILFFAAHLAVPSTLRGDLRRQRPSECCGLLQTSGEVPKGSAQLLPSNQPHPGLLKPSKLFPTPGHAAALCCPRPASAETGLACLLAAHLLGGFPSPRSPQQLPQNTGKAAAARAGPCPEPRLTLPSVQGTSQLVLGCSPSLPVHLSAGFQAAGWFSTCLFCSSLYSRALASYL